MLGRGRVVRARLLSVTFVTACFPRGTAEGTNQLRKKTAFLSILKVKTHTEIMRSDAFYGV